ncbi:MAG: hypothetical protein H2057_03340 [Alphaproteobacteria bacterium]|nr:hypothetical protein [Alphaproteobacteria bacterium]
MIIISIIGTSDALLLDIFTQILIAPLATSLHLGYSKEDTPFPATQEPLCQK